jgi:hypothetical protein
LQPHRKGFKPEFPHLDGEYLDEQEVHICTQLSKLVENRLKLKKTL